MPGRGASPVSSLNLLLVAVALLVSAALFALAVLQNRAEVLRDGYDRLARSLAVLQEHTGKVMQTQEMALARVSDRIQGLTPEQVAAPGISDFLAGLRAPLDQAVSIWITDAEGVVRAGSQPWNPALRIADRDFFQVHRDGEPGPHVSAAFVGPTTGLPRFALSRRRAAPDGAFEGTIHIALSRAYFMRFFADAAPRLPHMTLLLRADGEVLASEPERGPARLASDDPLMQALAASPEGGAFEAVSPFDGAPHLYAHARVSDYPMHVVLGVPTRALLQRWHDNLRLFGAVAAVASALLLAVSWLAIRRAAAARSALRQLRAVLEDLRRETAGREAAESRARQAQRMEALGQLAGGVAHDVNNVLQAVASGARLILRQPDDAAQVRRLAGMVLDSTDRGAAVARRLLAFARQGELRAADIAAGPLLDDLRQVLTHTLGAGIAVRVMVAPGLASLRADKGQLETVLVNLATNARDAMAGQGGGVLTLTATEDAVAEGARHPAGLLPGRYVRIAVADSGCGMDAATLTRAAEPFFTTKPAGSGTGLGLAMAKGFAEQSGGGFSIKSTLGAGTTVTLWLPCSPPTDDGAAPAGEAARQPTAPVAPPRVLLAEDEALVRETLAAELIARGWRVRAAADVPEALHLLDAAPEEIDLLLTDYAMPGMSGLHLLRQARLRRPRLPGLLLTGLVDDGPEAHAAVAEAVRDGPFALLRKPVDAAELVARAEAMLHEAAREAPRA